MGYYYRLLIDIADRECKRISRSIIHYLQRLTTTTSGEDSGLKNVWDEVCVQVQCQHSGLWGAYVLTMEGLIGGQVAKLPPAMLGAIWLQTDAGFYWDEEEDGAPPVEEDDVVTYILERYVLSAADDWTNPRIEQYLIQGWD